MLRGGALALGASRAAKQWTGKLHAMNSTDLRRGFTLVELLVVVAIIALLMGLLLPAVQSAREAARRTQCGNNARQIAIAMLSHHTSMQSFPFGQNYPLRQLGNTQKDRQCWFHELLPFVEQQPLRDGLVAHLATGGSGWWTPNRWVPIPTFMCPSDPASPKAITGGWSESPGGQPENSQGFHGNYAACSGDTANNPNSMADNDPDGIRRSGLFIGSPSPTAPRRLSLDHCRDGASNTLLVGEIVLKADLNPGSQVSGGNSASQQHDNRGRYWNVHFGYSLFSTLHSPNTSVGDRLPWCVADPAAAPCQALAADNVVLSLRSRHPGGGHGALADGAVRFFTDAIDPVAYRGLGSRAGRELPPEP